MAPEEGDPLQKKLAANQGPKPTSYTRTYLLSSQVAKSQRCCLGAVGFVYNEQVRNEGWKAGLMELGIEMSVEEVNKLPRDELLALSSRVMETKGFRQMLEYVKEAVKPCKLIHKVVWWCTE